MSQADDVPNPLPPGSRYSGVATGTLRAPNGDVVVYLRRRAIPPPGAFAAIAEHVVEEGDRIDAIAAERLGDPEQFWRICDANAAIAPGELTETIGRRIRIALPAGIPGGSNV